MSTTTLGAELSLPLFPTCTWQHRDPGPPAHNPYPGFRPTGSWRLFPAGPLHGVSPSDDGWRDRANEDRISLAGRRLILGYGSNLDPAKLLARPEFFCGQEVLVLRAAVFGWAAAWCDARRTSGEVVATLIPAPERVEVHALLAVTPDQLEAMDRWEGHPNYYRRDRHCEPVLLEDHTLAADVEVYLGATQKRPTLLSDRAPLLCAEVGYDEIDTVVEGSRR